MLVKLSGSIVRCVYQTTFRQDQLYRLQDMSFRILLLVAAILRTSNGTEIGMRYQPCEYEHLHECTQGFVAGLDAHPEDPNMGVYCDVFQVPN